MVKILVTTEGMCRGIEGQNVITVINFDVAINADSTNIDIKSYIQRIGRAGRFGGIPTLLKYI